MKLRLRSAQDAHIHCALPAYVKQLLLHSGTIVSVVGLNEADLLFAHDAIYAYCANLCGTPANKIAEVMQPCFLFRHASVAENIFLKQNYPFHIRRKVITHECIELFARFGVQISPWALVQTLNDDEKKITELLRALEQHPRFLFLYNTLSFIGYSYKNIFSRILKAFKEEGCTIIYLTPKWEDGLSLGDNFTIIYREQFLEKHYSSEELRANPQRMVYLLSGLDLDHIDNEVHDLSFNVLDSINSSSKLFINNYEIDQSIQHLLQSVHAALESDSCIMYILSESKSIQIISDEPVSTNPYKLKESYAHYLIENETTPQHFQIHAQKRADYFQKSDNDAYYMILMPIQVSSKTQGFLQLVYRKQIIYSKAQMLALDTFCSEVSIIIETSKLINQSVLMRESHHRIKNNLQVIIGLLISQKQHITDPTLKPIIADILDNTIDRIKSISVVHDLLSQNTIDNSLIPLDSMVNKLIGFFEDKSYGVVIERDIDAINIFYNKATSVAMIITELINNSIKHAFRERSHRLLQISCKQDANALLIKVADNGSGFKPGFDICTADTNGISIIQSLIKSMNGSIRAYNADGATVEISLPLSAISNETLS